MDQNKGTILVTGATSFVGTHVIKTFLQNGYHVRGQVRNARSGEKVLKAFPTAGAALATVEVPDITVPGAFDAAVRDVAGVIHCASPFVLSVEDNERDLLAPAVQGTTRVLEAVAAHAPPQVRRVVVTSSFAAIAALADHAGAARAGYAYTEADWNTTTYEEAVATPAGPVAYCASKTLAERAAWAFVERETPGFTVSTVCPPMIYGPVEHDADVAALNTSIADVYRFLDGSQAEPGPTLIPLFADVRDVAEAHLRAFERAAPGRFFVTSGTFEYIDVCRILREVLPGRRDKIPDPELTPRAQTIKADNTKTARELGMTFRSLDECIRDTALSLVALEQGKTWREVSSSA